MYTYLIPNQVRRYMNGHIYPRDHQRTIYSPILNLQSHSYFIQDQRARTNGRRDASLGHFQINAGRVTITDGVEVRKTSSLFYRSRQQLFCSLFFEKEFSSDTILNLTQKQLKLKFQNNQQCWASTPKSYRSF